MLDSDRDGTSDLQDACPYTNDPTQQDRDGDGIGDACDRCPDRHDPTNLCGGAGLPLDAGVNLVAAPVDAGDPSLSAFDLLASIGDDDQVASIARFDPAGAVFERAYYDNGEIQGDDFPIRPDEG